MTTHEEAKNSALIGKVTNHLNRTGGPAQGNVTVRDYFAAKALPSAMMISSQQATPDQVAVFVYTMADAMLKARL
jgi:hypothetical protein